MAIPSFVDISEVRESKAINSSLIDNAALVARNTPTACELTRTLIDNLERHHKKEGFLDGETESFLSQLKYVINHIEQDNSKLHKSLIKAGHKEKLYYKD